MGIVAPAVVISRIYGKHEHINISGIRLALLDVSFFYVPFLNMIPDYHIRQLKEFL